jgi:hypothetical protein
MKLTLSILLTIILSSLSLLHVYWAAGGQWGFDKALPTTEDGVRILNPKTIDSIIVGIGLSLFALFYLHSANLVVISFPGWITKIGLWLIPIIFSLRAIGDFKYIGFFKQIKTTEFAQLDTVFYSPLCVTIALIGFVVTANTKV